MTIVATSSSLLLLAASVAAIVGTLPDDHHPVEVIVELAVMGALALVGVSCTINLRYAQHLVAKYEATAGALEVSGAVRSQKAGSVQVVTIGPLAFRMPQARARQLLRQVRGGQPSVTCVVGGKEGVRVRPGLITATAGTMLRKPMTTRVVGL